MVGRVCAAAGLGEEARQALDELMSKRQGSRRFHGASARPGASSRSPRASVPLEGGEAEGAAEVSVPAHALVVALMLQAEKLITPLRRRTRLFLAAVGLVSCFGTTAARTSLGGAALGSSVLQTVVIVGAWVITATQMGLVFQFIAIGAIDNERHCRALNLLGRLLLPPSPEAGSAQVAVMMKASQEACEHGSTCAAAVMPAPRGARAALAPKTPILSLDSARAARAFLATRRLINGFGKGYHARLLMVTATVVALGVGAAAFALASMLLSTDAPTTLASVVIMHVLVLPVAAIIWLDLQCASRTNDAAAAHAAIVTGARLELRFALHDDLAAAAAEGDTAEGANGGKGAGTAEPLRAQGRGGQQHLVENSILPLLEDLERSLRVQEVPVIIFGHAASSTLTQSFVGLWLSVETTVLSILVGRTFVGVAPSK